VSQADPTRWLDAQEQVAWRAFLEGSARLFERLGRVLDAAGLSLAEYEILVRLSEVPAHEIRMSELAAAVVHSRSRLTHTVARMESAGLVQRAASPDDGRGVLCRLTASGLDLLVDTAPGHVTSVREALLDSMTREEFLSMGTAMGRVADGLRDGRETPC
jgi:DNA-binding MarR family transcriptional regulator